MAEKKEKPKRPIKHIAHKVAGWATSISAFLPWAYYNLPIADKILSGKNEPGDIPMFLLQNVVYGIADFMLLRKVVEQAYKNVYNYNRPQLGVFVLDKLIGSFYSIKAKFHRAAAVFAVSPEGRQLQKDKSIDVLVDHLADHYHEAISDNSPKKDLALASYAFLEKDETFALEKITDWLNKYNSNQEFRKLLEINYSAYWLSGKIPPPEQQWLPNKKGKEPFAELLTKIKDEPYPYLMYLAFHHLSNKNVFLASKVMDLAFQKSNYSKPADLGLAMTLYELGNREQARKFVQNYLGQNPEIIKNAKLVQGSGRAYRPDSDFFGNVLIFKKGTQANLQSEWQNLKNLEAELGIDDRQDEIGIAQPVSINKMDDNTTLLTTFFANGPSAFEVYQKNPRKTVMGMRQLGYIHAVSTPNPIEDGGVSKAYSVPHLEKMLDRLPDLPINIKQNLIENYDALSFNSDLAFPYLVRELDFHPHQIIVSKVGDKDKFVMIEMEDKGLQNMHGLSRPEYDIVKHLFQGKYLINQKNILEDAVMMYELNLNITSSKLKGYSSDYPNNMRINRHDTFLASVLLASLAKMITYTIHSASIPNPRQDGHLGLASANYNAKLLLDNDVRFGITKKIGHKIENLMPAMDELKNYYIAKLGIVA